MYCILELARWNPTTSCGWIDDSLHRPLFISFDIYVYGTDNIKIFDGYESMYSVVFRMHTKSIGCLMYTFTYIYIYTYWVGVQTYTYITL